MVVSEGRRCRAWVLIIASVLCGRGVLVIGAELRGVVCGGLVVASW